MACGQILSKLQIMILANNSLLNIALNQNHRWNEPENNPFTRMLLTRLTGTVCAVIEIASIVFKLIQIGMDCAKQFLLITSKAVLIIFPQSKFLHSYHHRTSLFQDMRAKGFEIAKLIAGTVSTLFFGIIFSPEINFKIHLKLKLAIDNLAESTKRKQTTRIEAEMNKAEITKARAERFSKLEAEQNKTNQNEEESHAIDSRLAELLLPQSLN